MKYIPPLDGDQYNPNRSWINGDPATETDGSAIDVKSNEYPQREILAVIEAAGLVPSNADLTQLLAAINGLIGSAFYVTKRVWVNPTGGNDDNDGTSVADAVQTLDKAIEMTVHASVADIELLGDVTLSKSQATGATVHITGWNATGTATQARTITVADAATNGVDELGRYRPGQVRLAGRGAVKLSSINVVLPSIDTSGGTWVKSVFHGVDGLDLAMLNGTISCPDAASEAALMEGAYPGPAGFWAATVTLGTNAAGRVMLGVSAGADPNANKRFRSNLTSV